MFFYFEQRAAELEKTVESANSRLKSEVSL